MRSQGSRGVIYTASGSVIANTNPNITVGQTVGAWICISPAGSVGLPHNAEFAFV